jgi:uncharacterized protein DUF5916/cellulose/xylan binding protein with CBM9 domain
MRSLAHWKMILFALANCVALVSGAAGQMPSVTEVPRIRAMRAMEPIKVDGRLDEPAWAKAEAATDFRMENPKEGAPASERTEVRVLFDDKNIYFGIRAFDSEPDKINARELTRDADFANDDKIEILLDTNHDRRNAYRFAVNPLGTQQDALITDEGRFINLTWDAAWLSAGRVDDDGYTVEIAIPLTSLRYKEGVDAWGFNVARIIKRKNEENLWTSWRLAFGLERVSQAGELTGLEELRRRRLLEFKPYVTGAWRQGAPLIGRPGYDAGARATGGLEVARIGLTPSLTAEVTINPDFGQAEVDQQVINLSRFSVFFPERRDFFLENAGVFQFGREEINQLFFTRRIGLTENGEPLPIDYGAKITGKIGQYNVGFLQVQTRELNSECRAVIPPSAGCNPDSFIPRRQYTVARVKRDLFKRSSIGAMFVDRQGGREGGAITEYNRGAGVDLDLNVTDYWRVSGFLMGTATPGVHSSFLSGRATSYYEDNLFRSILVYESIGKNFNPEMGFIERGGIKQYFGQAAYKPRPKFLPFVQQMEFETQLEYYEDNNTRPGRLSTRQTELSWETEFRNSSTLFFRPVEDVTDVLTEPFEIRPGVVIPKGTYSFNRPRVSFASNQSRRIVFTASEKWGEFYSGARSETQAGMTLRPNRSLLVDLVDTYNRVRLPQGNFSTNLFGGRISYNFSRRLLTSAFVQLNSAAQLSSLNFRLRYIFRPYSDLFVIYNQTTGRGLERPSHQLQFKLTYYLQM